MGAWPAEETKFTVSRDKLVQYDYSRNSRFSIGTSYRLDEAVHAVVSARLMEHATIPNIAQLRLVEELMGFENGIEEATYRQSRDAILDRLALSAETYSPFTYQQTYEALQRLRPTSEDFESFKANGDLGHLHRERELLIKSFGICFSNPAICDQLRAVISNSRFEYTGTVDLAIWALGRQNYKGSIPYLIDMLEKLEFDASTHVIERALQFLCSGEQLIPLSAEAPTAYWLGVTKQLPTNLDDWAAHDAKSVFWEKRLRCARQWSQLHQHITYLENLKSDEVSPVRHAAGI